MVDPLTPCLMDQPAGDSWQPLLRPGLALRLRRRWWNPPEGESLASLQRHLAALPWEQPWISVYGRRHPVPRLSCWIADPGHGYRYSGLEQRITPWTPPLLELRRRLRELLGVDFNSLLLNRYRNGRDAMGWHADDEPELDPEAPIASLSLGASRTLRFRPHPRRGPTAEPPLSLELSDGDLLLMDPPTQRHWQHALPVRRRTAAERLNLTFRVVRPTQRLSR